MLKFVKQSTLFLRNKNDVNFVQLCGARLPRAKATVIIINDAAVAGVHAALGAKKADQKGVYRNQEKEKVLRFGNDIP